MEQCAVMVLFFGAWMFFGWIFFDKDDWNGGGKKE